MVDNLSKSRRSANMAAIRSANTKPELAVRRLAHSLGYRFRLHRKDLPGKPDLVFVSRCKIIFVHGCFWHQHSRVTCRDSRVPKTNTGYWQPKLRRNILRDRQNQKLLIRLGWKVTIVWECEVANTAAMRQRLKRFLDN